jgi:hypothetical protein
MPTSNPLAYAVQFVTFTRDIDFGFLPNSGNIQFVNIKVENTNITPANVTVSNITTNGCVTFRVSGTYGSDIAVNDTYKVVANTLNKTYVQYTDFFSVNVATYEHLYEFNPEAFGYKTINIYFLANNISNVSYQQLVYPDHSRHRERCISLVNRESPNRG